MLGISTGRELTYGGLASQQASFGGARLDGGQGAGQATMYVGSPPSAGSVAHHAFRFPIMYLNQRCQEYIILNPSLQKKHLDRLMPARCVKCQFILGNKGPRKCVMHKVALSHRVVLCTGEWNM